VAGAAAGATAAAPSAPDAMRNYFVDMLFRTDRPLEAGANTDATRREAGGIVANALVQGDLSQGDRTYLAQLVAARTGLPPADAEQRVTKTVTAAKLAADAASAKAREAAETARKVTAYTALWVFVSLSARAFVAAFAATWAGASAIRRCTRGEPCCCGCWAY
jgi:hypothetical protein